MINKLLALFSRKPPADKVDLKNKANLAFQASNWTEAIDLYSQAISLDPKDALCIANRSAAYMKLGRLEESLKDAHNCRLLDPTNSIGYLREAAVLFAEKKYEGIIAVLNEGIEKCADKQGLESALRGAQRPLLWKMPACQTARKMMAAYQAAQIRQSTLTSDEAKAKQLLESALNNKEILLKELEALGDDPKVLEILFHFVSGPSSLAILQSLGPAWEKALSADQEPMKNPESFVHAIQQVANETNTTSTSLATQIVQAVVKSPPATVSNTVQNKDRRTMALFLLLDQDGLSEVAFPYLAQVCYGWAMDNLDQNLQASTKLLVLMEPDDNRRLDYAHFGKFLLSLASTWNDSLEDVLDELILACVGTPRALTEEELQAITVQPPDIKGPSQDLDPLTYTRIKHLFELWDTNKDGDIDFSELLAGLRRYQLASQDHVGSPNAQAEKIAIMIMGHDEDHNQTLDPDEFAVAMVNYAKAVGTDLHQLIDFMSVVVPKTEEDSMAFEKAYSDATLANSKKKKVFRPSITLTAIMDIEESEEEEEE